MVVSTYSRKLQEQIVKPTEDPRFNLFDATGKTLVPDDDLLYYKFDGDLRKYESIEHDPVFGSHCDERRKAPTKYELKTHAGGSRPDDLLLNAIVKKATSYINFNYLTECLMHGHFTGRSLVEHFPEVKTLDLEVEGQKFTRECLIPTRIEPKDPARLIFGLADNPKRTLHCLGYEARQTTIRNWSQGEPLPLNKFIVHHYGSLTGNPYGNGIYRRLYWLNEFKKEVLRLGLINSDGKPTPYLTYNKSLVTEEEIAEAKKMLEGFYTRSWMMLPDAFQVNFASAFVQGQVDALKDFLAWFDSQAATCIIGATLTSGTDSEATRGNSEVHYRVTESRAKSDSDALSEALELYYIEPIALWNLPNAARPTIYRDFTPPIDREKEVKIDSQLFAMGYKPTEQRIIDIYGENQYIPIVVTEEAKSDESDEKDEIEDQEKLKEEEEEEEEEEDFSEADALATI